VAGNEPLIAQAFDDCGIARPQVIDPPSVDAVFVAQSSLKGGFALALAQVLDSNLAAVVVPTHIAELFDWLALSPVVEPGDEADDEE